MRQEQSEHLAASIVEFSRFLRSNGVSADTSQTMTALEAARTIDIANTANLLLGSAVDALLDCKEEWEVYSRNCLIDSGANHNPGRGLLLASTWDPPGATPRNGTTARLYFSTNPATRLRHKMGMAKRCTARARNGG